MENAFSKKIIGSKLDAIEELRSMLNADLEKLSPGNGEKKRNGIETVYLAGIEFLQRVNPSAQLENLWQVYENWPTPEQFAGAEIYNLSCEPWLTRQLKER